MRYMGGSQAVLLKDVGSFFSRPDAAHFPLSSTDYTLHSVFQSLSRATECGEELALAQDIPH